MQRSIYVRPVGMFPAKGGDGPLPEQPETWGGLPLAGTRFDFAALEVIAREGTGVVRRTVSLSEAFERDWGRHTLAAADLIEALRTPRPRLAGLSLDRPRIMGIVNVTPDSFSDGGRFVDDPAGAADAGFAMLTQGASLIDIGGESTRPDAAPDAPVLWEGDEIARVVPAIRALARSGAIVSVDTRKAAVMEAALDAGAHMVNDVSALLFDSRALDVVRQAGCPVVLMHAPSQGQNPHKGAIFRNVVTDVFDWLEARIAAVVQAGIARDRIIVDPGIGFGKTLADNLALINALPLLHALGQPVLFGASRKRMIGALSNEAPVDARLGGSLALALTAIGYGAQLVRVHDVAETVQAARVWRGLRDAALTMPGLD